MNKPPNRSFTEGEAKRLLDRATKLEAAQRAVVSDLDLMDIAADAGIGPSAFSAAIHESHLLRSPVNASRLLTALVRSRSQEGAAEFASIEELVSKVGLAIAIREETRG